MQARQAIRRGDYAEALRLSDESFSGGGDLGLSEPERAVCYLATGRIDEAAELLERRLREAPEDPWALTYQACTMEFQGLVSDAVKTYRKALVASPNSILANANLGYLLLTRRNVSGSIACLRRSAEAGSRSEPASLYFPSFSADALPQAGGTADDARLSAACLMVGMKLQELGRFDQARQAR